MLQGALEELRATKQSAAEAFFARAASADAAFHASCLQLAERALADFGGKHSSGGGGGGQSHLVDDDELYATLADHDAAHASLRASRESHAATLAAAETAWRDAEDAACAGTVARLRQAELERSRARVGELAALAAACAARVAAALDAEGGGGGG